MGWLRVLQSKLSAERVVILLIAAFGLFHLIGLDRLPLVHVDEPWIAEPGYRFWDRGTLSSELARGFYHAEDRYLLHAPAFSLITGAAVAWFGPGLIQVRLVSLAIAVATAALTFWLGRALFTSRHGLIAVVALATWRVVPPLLHRPTGIPLADFGRLARYDLAVATFGVAGLLLVLPLLIGARAGGTARGRRSRLLLAGILASVAFACHPVGLVWIIIIGSALIVLPTEPPARRATHLALFLSGGAIALAPWIRFVLSGWGDFVAQQGSIGERYDLLNGWFYVTNVVNEWRRYGSIGRGLLAAQPGAWLLSVCGLTGMVALWLGSPRRDRGARLLRTSIVLAALLLAVGVQPKIYQYVAAIWPLIALVAAVGLVTFLEASSRAVRAAAITLLAIACTDGIVTTIGLARAASATTPYAVMCDRLAAALPREARLLALPSYWFGLESRVQHYRSMIAPMLLIRSFARRGDRPPTNPLAEIDPDVILLDEPMLRLRRDVLDPRAPRDPAGLGARMLIEYLAAYSLRNVILDDPSYGRFEIHYLRRASAATAVVTPRR